MSGIFIKVMCSDRLPKVEKSYLTNAGWVSTHITESCIKWKIIENPTWWLEEIELPSDENKQAIVKEWYKDQQFKSNYPAQPSSFMAGFNKAIELIKGDK